MGLIGTEPTFDISEHWHFEKMLLRYQRTHSCLKILKRNFWAENGI